MGGRTRENCTRFLTGGRRGTQGTNFTGKTKQWENKEPLPAILTTFSGVFIPELPEKQKNTHTKVAEMKTYLDWILNVTGTLYCKHQTHNWLTQGKQENINPGGGTANPKCPTCSRAGRCKHGEVAPAGKATLVGSQDKLQLTTPRDNRRDTPGNHVIPSQNTQQPDPDKLLGKARGQEEKQWTRVNLDTRFLGSHWVQALLTLDQGLGLEGHRSCTSVSQGIQLSHVLYCIVWLRSKSIYVLFFPVFNRSNSTYSSQSIPNLGPKWFINSFLKQHMKILGWTHK